MIKLRRLFYSPAKTVYYQLLMYFENETSTETAVSDGFKLTPVENTILMHLETTVKNMEFDGGHSSWKPKDEWSGGMLRGNTIYHWPHHYLYEAQTKHKLNLQHLRQMGQCGFA